MIKYRVVYGETMPAWEMDFKTLREAKAFAAEHRTFGDMIFYVGRIDGAPNSLMRAIKGYPTHR